MIPPRSVRARLTLWYSAVLAVVLISFSAISYVLLSRHIRALTDESLAGTAKEFIAAFEDPEPAGGIDRGEPMRLDFRYSNRAILVFRTDGRLLLGPAADQIPAGAQAVLGEAVRSRKSGYLTLPGGVESDGYRVFIAPFGAVGKRYAVAAIRSLQEQTETLEFASRSIWVGIPLSMLIASAGGYLLARKSLAPVMVMTRQARRIGADRLSERVAVNNPDDELGFLGTTLNSLLARLEASFSAQRRFMADASHELRTPLAILRGETDVALTRDRPASEYRQTLEVMQRTIRKLSSIVSDLFLLSRSDLGEYPVRKSRFYLDELVEKSVESFRTLAMHRQQQLTFHSQGETIVNMDEELIGRLVSNLIDNAIKYTPHGGRIEVTLQPHGDRFCLTVRDSGGGIPPDAQSRIFERFFRANRLRGANDTSPPPVGAGLGLPIASWIAGAHGGRLWLESSGENGSLFVAEIPTGIPD